MMNNTISFKTTSKICILVSGKEDTLQLNLRDSPGSVAESAVLLAGQRGSVGFPPPSHRQQRAEAGNQKGQQRRTLGLRYINYNMYNESSNSYFPSPMKAWFQLIPWGKVHIKPNR